MGKEMMRDELMRATYDYQNERAEKLRRDALYKLKQSMARGATDTGKGSARRPESRRAQRGRS